MMAGAACAWILMVRGTVREQFGGFDDMREGSGHRTLFSIEFEWIL